MLKKDLKKHLLRAKQIAEQNFGRADKSEVLTDDLELLDRRINHIKQACHNVGKKVQLSVKDSGSDKEKRLKKIPEQQLAQQMIDFSSQLGMDTLMGELFHQCGDTQAAVARVLVEYEVEVESRVLAPIHTMTEQEIPNIHRKKKQLEKCVLDYDTARSRFISSQEKHQGQPGGAAKIEAAQSEMEEAHNRVDQCRDQLSTDMFSFQAKEAENSKFLIDLIKVQADYHERALKELQQAIPRMEEICDHNKQMPVYGTPLEEHLQRTNREIASVIEICIAILAEEALEEEGLFRIAGGSSKVKKVKAAFDACRVPDMEEIRDIHCIAGALKLYLRELPEPLLTFNLYNEWMQASHLPHDEKMQTLWVICDKLPKANYNNLRYLIKFLGKLAEKSNINKMSPSNIAIVIGPNLLWPRDSGQNVLTTASQSSLAESLISHSDYFFPGELVFKPIEKKAATSPSAVEKKPQHSSSVKYLSLGKRKGKSKDRSSIDSALSAASQMLTLPVSKPLAASPQNESSALHAQVIAENDILQNVPSKSPKSDKKEAATSEVDDQQSIDSGIGSSYSGSTQPSLKRKSGGTTAELLRPTTIFETADPNDGQLPSNGIVSGKVGHGSDSSLLQAHSSLVTEMSCKRAITPPPRPPPRSLHSDMYDTLFMLQTLKSGGTSPEGDSSVTDYLAKVRTIWDDQYKSPSKRFSIGPTHEEISTEGDDICFDIDGREIQGMKDRIRASSEPKVLDSGVEQLIDFRVNTSESQNEDPRPATEATVQQRGSEGSCDGKEESSSTQLVNNRGHEVEERNETWTTHGDIDFGVTTASDKSTPPGTLNRAPPTTHNTEHNTVSSSSKGSSGDVSHTITTPPGAVVQNHQPLVKSNSGNNLLAEGPSPDSPSPVVKRKWMKKPAPLPPNAVGPHGVDKTGSLERRNKPPSVSSMEKHPQPAASPSERTSGEKPMLSPAAPEHRPPVPDRPLLGPPPAIPNKPLSPVELEHPVGGGDTGNKTPGTYPPPISPDFSHL